MEYYEKYRFPIPWFDLTADEYFLQFVRLCERLTLPFDRDAAREFFAEELVHDSNIDNAGLPRAAAQIYEALIERRLM